MTPTRQRLGTLALAGASMVFATTAVAQAPVRIAGTTCEAPPVLKCPDEGCASTLALLVEGGPVVEQKTERNFFLEYPCDLQPGEEVTFVLSLHGIGSYGNWQRHYFPLVNYKDTYRLVIATPNAPAQRWAESDDEYLQNIVTFVVDQIGPQNIRSFWLAGHSQGGITARRLICTPFFREKVDGFMSLSSVRVGGQAPISFTPPGRGGAAGGGGDGPGPGAGGAGAPPAAAGGGGAADPDCDFSHIFAAGELEVTQGLAGLPQSSTWAQRFGCSDRAQRADVVDTGAGYVFDSRSQENPNPSWGRMPRPGTAHMFVYPDCSDGRIVADVLRMDKGHTEGLEPMITEELVRMMVSASGGKLQR